MMNVAAFTICKRELGAYFNSVIGYVYIFVFLLFNGFLYMAQFFITSVADMRAFFNILPIVLAVFIPAITMGLWSEERKSNTFELLLTFPARALDLVLGKFLAAFIFFLTALLGTFVIPVMLFILGSPDPGPMIGGYVGGCLLGGFFLSLGILISGFAKDQIVAFILTTLVALSLVLVGTGFIATTMDGWVPGLGSFLRQQVSVTSHLASFHKGVLDLGDALYFAGGITIFLVLNGFWIEGRMRPKRYQIFATALGLMCAIFVMANMLLGDWVRGRLDLTSGKLYTVSEQSRSILRGLESPVTVKYYVSPEEKMPTDFKHLEQRVTDKLDEFGIYSNGKFQFKVFHVDASKLAQQEETLPGEEVEESLESRLTRKGIIPFQVESVEADEVGVRLIYSAMALSFREKAEEIIPHILPQGVDEMEYVLISKIYRMTLEKKPQVVIIAPYSEISVDPAMLKLMTQMGQTLPIARKKDDYSLLTQALQSEGYETERLELSEDNPLPEGTDTLIVLDPEGLTIGQLKSVDQFLGQGGSVFLAVQNFEFDYKPSPKGVIEVQPKRKNHKINDLLEPWGIGVDERFLIDQNSEVLNISSGASLGLLEISVPLKLPIHVRIDAAGMNANVPLTDRLSSLLYLWGSALKENDEVLENMNVRLSPLLMSSKKSWLIPIQAGSLGAGVFKPGEDSPVGPFTLALLMEGIFPPAFERPSDIEEAEGRLVLIGAATPFKNELIREGGHWTFFMNAMDHLALDVDLTQVRTKRSLNRLLGTVPRAEKAMWRFLSSLAVPIAMGILGLLRHLWRRREKRIYLQRGQVP